MVALERVADQVAAMAEQAAARATSVTNQALVELAQAARAAASEEAAEAQAADTGARPVKFAPSVRSEAGTEPGSWEQVEREDWQMNDTLRTEGPLPPASSSSSAVPPATPPQTPPSSTQPPARPAPKSKTATRSSTARNSEEIIHGFIERGRGGLQDHERRELSSLAASDLRIILRGVGRPVRGTKKEQIDRLEGHYATIGDCSHRDTSWGGNQSQAWLRCKQCGVYVETLDRPPRGGDSRGSGTFAVHDVAWTDAQPGQMLLDSGCRRSVAGRRWHKAFREHLRREFGLRPVEGKCKETFRFGNDQTEISHRFWDYPVAFLGREGVLRVSEVASETPPLFSKSAMAANGLAIDFGNDTVSCDGQSHALETVQGGHLVLSLADWDKTRLLRVPPEFRIGGSPAFRAGEAPPGDSMNYEPVMAVTRQKEDSNSPRGRHEGEALVKKSTETPYQTSTAHRHQNCEPARFRQTPGVSPTGEATVDYHGRQCRAMASPRESWMHRRLSVSGPKRDGENRVVQDDTRAETHVSNTSVEPTAAGAALEFDLCVGEADVAVAAPDGEGDDPHAVDWDGLEFKAVLKRGCRKRLCRSSAVASEVLAAEAAEEIKAVT